MEITKLANGITIIMSEKISNSLEFVFTNFGLKTDIWSNKVGIIHFAEHILAMYLSIATNYIWTAATSFSTMTFIVQDSILDKEIDILVKALKDLFIGGKIKLANGIIKKKHIKTIRYHIFNELLYRETFKEWSPIWMFYTISGLKYVGGDGLSIPYDFSYYNKIFGQINTSNIIISTNNKYIKQKIIDNFTKVKTSNLNNNITKNVSNIKLPKQKIKNSILAFSLCDITYASILLPKNMTTLIGIFIFVECIYKHSSLLFLNNQIMLNIHAYSINELLGILSNIDKIKPNLYLKHTYDYIKKYYMWYPLDIFKIVAYINKHKSIKKYIKEVKYTLNIIKKNINKYNTFIINLPYNNILINGYDKYNKPIFYTEIILNIPKNINYTSIINSNIKSIDIYDISVNTNLCFLLCANGEVSLFNDIFIINNPQNVFINDLQFTVSNYYYLNKLPIKFYELYIFIYLCTNIFTKLSTIVSLLNYYTTFNYIQTEKTTSGIKLKLSNITINISCEYNFVALLIQNNIDNKKIDELSLKLVNANLIYVVRVKYTDSYIYLFIFTTNPIKAHDLCIDYLKQNKIDKIISIISLEGKEDLSNLYNAKQIEFS